MDIHDFEITGVEVIGDDRFSLRLFNPLDQARYEMCFENVSRLFVDGFSLQNIVLDVSLFTAPVEEFGFRRASTLLNLDGVAGSGMQDGDCIMLIEASAGAEVACLWKGPSVPVLSRIPP